MESAQTMELAPIPALVIMDLLGQIVIYLMLALRAHAVMGTA